MTEPSSQPHLSPDGHWRWDGSQWVPHQPAPTDPTLTGGYPAAPGYGPPAGYGTPPGYGAPPPYGQPYGQPYAPAPGTDGKAVGSLIASILGLFCFVGSIVGVILGHLSRSEARKQGREPSGLSLAGLIIGYVGVALLAVGLVLLTTGAFVVGFNGSGAAHCSPNITADCS